MKARNYGEKHPHHDFYDARILSLQIVMTVGEETKKLETKNI